MRRLLYQLFLIIHTNEDNVVNLKNCLPNMKFINILWQIYLNNFDLLAKSFLKLSNKRGMLEDKRNLVTDLLF